MDIGTAMMAGSNAFQIYTQTKAELEHNAPKLAEEYIKKVGDRLRGIELVELMKISKYYIEMSKMLTENYYEIPRTHRTVRSIRDREYLIIIDYYNNKITVQRDADERSMPIFNEDGVFDRTIKGTRYYIKKRFFGNKMLFDRLTNTTFFEPELNDYLVNAIASIYS